MSFDDIIFPSAVCLFALYCILMALHIQSRKRQLDKAIAFNAEHKLFVVKPFMAANGRPTYVVMAKSAVSARKMVNRTALDWYDNIADYDVIEYRAGEVVRVEPSQKKSEADDTQFAATP
jgi:hypothetical protein